RGRTTAGTPSPSRSGRRAGPSSCGSGSTPANELAADAPPHRGQPFGEEGLLGGPDLGSELVCDGRVVVGDGGRGPERLLALDDPLARCGRGLPRQLARPRPA